MNPKPWQERFAASTDRRKCIAEQYIPQNAAAWIQSVVSAKWQFLILVNLFLLALGCVMDIISAILIVAPLLAPIAVSYGIHPLHFGIMFIVNIICKACQ